MDKPFQAYAGDEPYVFVCYAHEDSELVYPELVWLREQGINIWYDEGISAGENWRAAIGDALLKANKFLIYLSARSLKSDHCNREINLALDEAKDVVPVYLEEVKLTSDLMVGLTRVQALHRDQDENYQRHLLSALGHSTSTANTILDSAVVKPRRSWLKLATATSLLLVATLILGYVYRDALTYTLVMNSPGLLLGDPLEQELGIVTTADGTRIAYATSGEGPPIVQVLGMGVQLGIGTGRTLYDNDGLVEMSSRDHLFVRYDGRGFGLSDRDADDFSLQARVSELEAVVNALGLERFGLYAVSAGGPVGIAYAAQHPEHVTHLVLAGTFASMNWMTDEQRNEWQRMIDMFELNWQRPAVTNMFAELLLSPDENELERRVFGAILRGSADGSTIAALLRSLFQIDSRELAKRIRVPTLVIHARDDAMVDMKAARDLAALVQNSILEVVEGSHMTGGGSSPEVRRRILDFFEMEQ